MESKGKWIGIAGIGCCVLSLFPFFLALLIFLTVLSGVSDKDPGASTFAGPCDIKVTMMPPNMRTMFCEAGAEYNMSAAMLAALYCRESGITNGNNTNITIASFGRDLNVNYREQYVDRCVRNSATATGPTQIIDLSWSGVPSWAFGTIPDSQKGNDTCSGGSCRGAKSRFELTAPPSRCRWGDAVFSQAALVFGKISTNAWNAGTACQAEVVNGKLGSPVWSIGCIEAIAHAYLGGPGYENRVVEPFKQLRE